MSQEQAKNEDLTSKPGPKGIPIATIIDYIENRNLSLTETAKLLDCTKSNIKQRLDHIGLKPGYLKTYKENKADILATYQYMILNSLTPDELKKASFSQKMMGYGILFDKERLERGGEIGVNNQSLTIVFNSLPPAVSEELQRKLLTMMQPGKGG